MQVPDLRSEPVSLQIDVYKRQHQSIPINGIATLTLSVDILPGEGDAEAMVETIEQNEGIHYLKILGRE